MRSIHSIRVALAALAAALPLAIGAQQLPPAAPDLPEPSASSLTIFVRAVAVGSEQVAVARRADGWTMTISGRLNAPMDVVTRRLEIRYDPDWKPLELTLDATVRGQAQALHTTVNGSTLTTVITVAGQSSTLTAQGDVDVLLPNPFFAAYEAVAARLRTAAAGSTISAYFVPQAVASITVGESVMERIQTASELIETKRTHLTITAGTAPPVEADLWGDPRGRFLRLSVPAQGLEVVREDIASVASRHVPISRANDEQVKIPSVGFSLAGTVSKPASPTSGRLPAVVLVGGSGPTDRDELVFGIPILGQLADKIADAGFMTLRYDKRGVGQSGGRPESASLADYAEDLRAAVKFLSQRKDVDPKRIAVVGHSEGGAVALIAAAKDKRIAAVGLLATNGVPGSDLILEQQQHALDRMKVSDAEKQEKVTLQKRINEAVITGTGWDQIPTATRRQVDTAAFQSILTHDPAKIIPKVRQPILIVQGELDVQVAPANADRLEALARKRKNATAVQVVRLPGVNHLLAPATTGELDEYAALKEKRISPAVSDAVVAWLHGLFTRTAASR